jgi:hypothetical protein
MPIVKLRRKSPRKTDKVCRKLFHLARIMGTSVRIIERHYGALLDGSGAEIASRLDAFEAYHERAAEPGPALFARSSKSGEDGAASVRPKS